jgi:hypothetical protein
MKKTSQALSDDLRPEYDFAAMKGGVRGKYARRVHEGTNIVVIAPEVADAYPTDQAVNEPLKGMLSTTGAVRRTGGLPNTALQPSRSPRKGKPRRQRGRRAVDSRRERAGERRDRAVCTGTDRAHRVRCRRIFWFLARNHGSPAAPARGVTCHPSSRCRQAPSRTAPPTGSAS